MTHTELKITIFLILERSFFSCKLDNKTSYNKIVSPISSTHTCSASILYIPLFQEANWGYYSGISYRGIYF